MPRRPNEVVWGAALPEKIPLSAALMEGFVTLYLLERFDNPQPIPELHRSIWELFCLPDRLVSIAAPRGHAKSSAGTHAFTLASILFGASDHVLIIGATEGMASDHLKDISIELRENETIVEQFRVKLLVDNETEIIGSTQGRMFRILAKGAAQKVRGIKWRHKRPNLIMIDDMEDDEAVMNVERRIKLREWVDDAVLPVGGDNCKIRALGTILHFDSWLEKTMDSRSWISKRFSAHESFDDFRGILWPEKFPESRLREIQKLYLESHNPSGYSQEYLNFPIADMDSYFRRSDMVPMKYEDKQSPKRFYVGVDFAISKADRSNQTAMVIGGVDSENFIHIVDCHAGRWDSLEIIDEMFRVEKRWKPDVWILEQGIIEKSLGPVIDAEMRRRGTFLDIVTMAPTKDKMSRAQAIRMRMRGHSVKFDKEGEWYPAFEQEILQFPRSGKDDRVDAIAWLGLFVDDMQSSHTAKELWEMERDEELEESVGDEGRNETTGY